MDSVCYEEGACHMCGCQTTALQCADNACDKPCYPEMMSWEKCRDFKQGDTVLDALGEWQLISTGTSKDRVEALVFIDARGHFRKRVSYSHENQA